WPRRRRQAAARAAAADGRRGCAGHRRDAGRSPRGAGAGGAARNRRLSGYDRRIMTGPATVPLQGGFLDPQGPVAAAERTIVLDATVVMLAVVVPVILMTIAFAWWFRRGNPHARRSPGFAYSGAVEVTVWS